MANFYVKDKYRTNKLSLELGGKTVNIEYQNGDVLKYDKIKYPKTYVRSLNVDNDTARGKIVKVMVDGELLLNW